MGPTLLLSQLYAITIWSLELILSKGRDEVAELDELDVDDIFEAESWLVVRRQQNKCSMQGKEVGHSLNTTYLLYLSFQFQRTEKADTITNH